MVAGCTRELAGRQARRWCSGSCRHAGGDRLRNHRQATRRCRAWDGAHLNCGGIRLLHHGCPAQRQRTLLLSRRRGILRLKDVWQVLSRCKR